MIPISSLVGVIVLLLLALGAAKRFLVSGTLSFEWMPVTRILSGALRLVVRAIGGAWSTGRFLVRFAHGRRKVRRLPTRVSAGSVRRAR
jgi:hypothetical protein